MATPMSCHLNSAADHTVYLITPELTTGSITFERPGSMLLVINFIYLSNKKIYSIFEDMMHNLCSFSTKWHLFKNSILVQITRFSQNTC
jgi:hypothetical protein